MKKILFVYHGSICRNPMVKYVMKDLIKKAGLEGRFQIAPEATSREELSNPVYPPTRRKLAEHDIVRGGRAAWQFRNRDYEEHDLPTGMDQANPHNMYRIYGGDFNDKIHLSMEHADHPGQEVAALRYANDFGTAWRDALAGCQRLLRELAGHLSNDILAQNSICFIQQSRRSGGKSVSQSKKTAFITVQDVLVATMSVDQRDYISLTDMTKARTDAIRVVDVIKNWLRA